MLADVYDVLTCSNFTCPEPPYWYAMAANWSAHLGIGAFIAAAFPARWAWALFAVLIVKEPTFDFARDPSLAVAGDSVLDVAAMMLGAWIAGRGQFRNPRPDQPLAAPVSDKQTGENQCQHPTPSA